MSFEAAKILRFIRGQCGGCLCARLCEPCKSEKPCVPSEAVVLRVTPERVVMEDERVFMRPTGMRVGPGQRVMVDCEPQIVPEQGRHRPRKGGREDDAPLILTPEYDTPQRPAAFGNTFHVPTVADGGIFTGESSSFIQMQIGSPVLDDGSLADFYAENVDHDRRLMLQYTSEMGDFTPLDDALPYHSYFDTSQKMILRTIVYGGGYGAYGTSTALVGYGGKQTIVNKKAGSMQEVPITWHENGLYFSGKKENQVVFESTRAIDSDDFQLLIDSSEGKVSTSYRQVIVDIFRPQGHTLERHSFVQAFGTGFVNRANIGITRWLGPYVEVSEIVETQYYRTSNNEKIKTPYWIPWGDAYLADEPVPFGEGEEAINEWLKHHSIEYLSVGDYYAIQKTDAWLTVSSRLLSKETVPSMDVTGWLYDYPVSNFRFKIVDIGPTVSSLRDIQWRDEEIPVLRFKALAGAITVRGLPTGYLSSLFKSELKAWNHTFSGADNSIYGTSWTALRDLPVLKDKKWDYSPAIVLHASETTVTAIRPDGKTESCSVAEFEQHVLRVPAGSFKGFATVGLTSHSWPPERAWANCDVDMRALIAHDPWRDSYKVLPRDSPNPKEWYWPARPPKRPRVLPKTAPRGLLGLTLADVTGIVMRDEQLKKGEGPLRVPIKATQTRADGTLVDVTRKVAKRLPYSPAGIPDERDDKTSVSGNMTVMFGPLPEVHS